MSVKRTSRTGKTYYLHDWIFVDGPAALADQAGKYVKHLGRKSFYELF